MRAFSYACSLAITWQRWRSHHSIHRTGKPRAARKYHGSVFDITRVIADRSVHCRGRNFSTFSAPVTLTLTQWPTYTNLTRNAWRYAACANMNFLRQGFRIVIVWQTYRQTYRHDQNNTQTSLRGWSKMPQARDWFSSIMEKQDAYSTFYKFVKS